MPSSWIEKRTVTTGLRFRVRYRVAGKGSVPRYGGSFLSEDEAQARSKWVRKELAAMRIPDIRRFSKRRPPRVINQKQKALDQVYSDARKLSQQMSLLRDSSKSNVGPLIAEAEGLTMKATDLIYDAWSRSQV